MEFRFASTLFAWHLGTIIEVCECPLDEVNSCYMYLGDVDIPGDSGVYKRACLQDQFGKVMFWGPKDLEGWWVVGPHNATACVYRPRLARDTACFTPDVVTEPCQPLTLSTAGETSRTRAYKASWSEQETKPNCSAMPRGFCDTTIITEKPWLEEIEDTIVRTPTVYTDARGNMNEIFRYPTTDELAARWKAYAATECARLVQGELYFYPGFYYGQEDMGPQPFPGPMTYLGPTVLGYDVEMLDSAGDILRFPIALVRRLVKTPPETENKNQLETVMP